MSEYTDPDPAMGTVAETIVALENSKVTAIGGKMAPLTSLVSSGKVFQMVESKGGISPAPGREGPRGDITPWTEDAITADVFPTPFPVSTVTKMADPAVVDKVVGFEG